MRLCNKNTLVYGSGIRDINQDTYPQIENLSPNLRRRVKHIIMENKRVLQMKNAITSNNTKDIN